MKNKPQDFCCSENLASIQINMHIYLFNMHIYLYQNQHKLQSNDGSQIMPCPAFMFVSKEGLVLDSSFSTFVSPFLRPFGLQPQFFRQGKKGVQVFLEDICLAEIEKIQDGQHLICFQAPHEDKRMWMFTNRQVSLQYAHEKGSWSISEVPVRSQLSK